ncbi:AAA family ATPase [Paenibacillus sp. 19GGS1-52]|uniref:AAA family ATPase n=1 Tax=Paenibacillus sp. 19GGS1-52 TaxID=2758563 RepID=UPI001EFA4282|nr:AAA family ATPase [Paenibacillus sp. 19GGS1-52]ULO05681.1 AAA family ATPase [Paenibacillus sp. 19GGS1-52]
MNIEQLKISGFGRLHNREIELAEGVTVLYGRNEAGKSTMLQFIRSMLFGIPGRGNPRERYEPVQGGLHGGILTARDRDGGSWTIRRYTSGESQGRSEKLNISLSRPDGTIEELAQSEMERQLLGGISRSMFRQLFAVSLTELQELATLQSDEMSGYLFHAGMGGGGDIMRAERRLLQDVEKLYKPRGKVQEAAKILQAIEKLERQIAESRSFLPRYNGNIAALENTEVELLNLEEQRRFTSEKLIMFRKALEIRGLWLKWSEARLELQGLPIISSFPEDGAARWLSLEGEIRNVEGAVSRLERLKSELTAELAQNPPDSLLAAQGPAVEVLDRRRSTYEDRRSERQRLEGERAALREHLQRILRGIDSGWSTAELSAFSSAAVDREAARRYAAAFSGYDRRMEAEGAARQALRSRLAAASAALQAAERALAREHAAGAEAFAQLAPRNAREVLQLWDELQQAAERWREALQSAGLQSGAGARSDGPSAKRLAALYRRLLLASAALSVLLPAALWLTGAPPLSAWIAFGLLGAADLALWAGWRSARRPETSPPQHGGDGSAAAADMLRLRELLLSGASAESAATGRLGRRPPESPSPAASGLEAGMKELRRLMDAWGAWQQRLERLGSERELCRTELATLAGQEKALAEEMRQAENVFTETAERYEEWLRQRKLPEGLSPEGLPDIFSLVEQGNELLRQETKLSQRLRELEGECAAYEEECLKLMNEAAVESSTITGTAVNPNGFSNTFNSSGNSALTILSWLDARKRAWEELKIALQRRNNLTSRLLEVEGELRESLRELSQLRQRCESLLREGGAADGEDFLRRSSSVQLRSELTKLVRQSELAMFGGWESQRTGALLELLDQNDASALEQERTAIEESAAQEEEARNTLLQQRGKLLQEREFLLERCMEDTVLQQLEEQRAALKKIAGQYAVAALTAELMGRTRRIYEEEKQPQVLLLASAYFAKLTEGEYLRVVMTLGHKELKAEHKDAGLLDSGLLSRGTAEQLYLAIRLALAETMSRQANLPLLFDDLFVNFDERRLHAALSLLGELSASRQIVMLTCHRHVAEAAARIISSAAVISV